MAYIRLSLCLLALLLLSGCSTFSETFKDLLSDSGIEPLTAQDPIARLRFKQRHVTLGESVQLDASLSNSKRGLPLSYQWTLLERPAGSLAVIDDDAVQARLKIDQPGRYRVQLVVNDGSFDSYPYEALLSTSADDLERVRFIVTGDTGTGAPRQYMVAWAMEQVCARRGCDFVVGLGDNIYMKGPKSVKDPQFQSKFEQPYADLHMPFFMTIGNHDASGLFAGDGGFNARGGIEVEYSQYSDKWTMPGRYYRFTAPLKGKDVRQNPAQNGQPLVEFFALDSTPMTSMPDMLPAYQLDSYVEQQEQWLLAAMRNSKAQWRIALAHHPYISNGVHGNAGNYDELRNSPYVRALSRLIPSTVLNRAAGKYYREFLDRTVCDRADLFLAGHDHNLQWLAPTARCGKTGFIVSGAGAKANGLKDPQRNPSWWQRGKTVGFFWVEITGDQLSASIYTVDRRSGDLTRAYDRTIRHSGG